VPFLVKIGHFVDECKWCLLPNKITSYECLHVVLFCVTIGLKLGLSAYIVANVPKNIGVRMSTKVQW
jgi:hypothetical protein